MPYPLRLLLRKENIALIRGEQIHFITDLLFAPEDHAPEMIRELMSQIYEYCSLCAPGILILNLDNLNLVKQLVIQGWQVCCKCHSDIFGEHHTVMLGKETANEDQADVWR